MYNNYSEFYQMLKLAFDKVHTELRVEQEFIPYLSNLVKFKRVKKGMDYINSGTEAKKVCIMLTGKCHVIKYTVDGKSVVVDSSSPIQIYGLNEMLNNIECYIATINVVEDACFIEIPTYYMKKKMNEDPFISNILVKYLSSMLNQSYERNCMEMLNTNEQNLICYLYRNCIKKQLPHRIVVDRKTMASELNVSLRSLYRYIDNLKNNNIISINCGKIEINQKQFEILEEKMERKNIF